MIRALLEHHDTRRDPDGALIVAADGTAMRGRRIAHAVNTAATLSGLQPGSAGYRRDKRYSPEAFGFSFTVASTLDRLRLPTPHPSSTAFRSDAPHTSLRSPQDRQCRTEVAAAEQCQ